MNNNINWRGRNDYEVTDTLIITTIEEIAEDYPDKSDKQCAERAQWDLMISSERLQYAFRNYIQS